MTLEPGISIADVDDTQLNRAVVSISGGFVAGDRLNFTNQLGITGSYIAATGVLTLSGTASLANYQTALRSIGFDSTSDDPGSGSRTISWTVRDVNFDAAANGQQTSLAGTTTVNVTPVNDAPVAVADTGTTAENVTLIVNAAGGVLANDTDLDLSDTHTVSAVNGVPGNVGAGVTGSNGGTFTIAANGSYTFNPGAAFDDLAVGQTRTTSVTYTNLDSNGGSASSTLTITVTGTNDAPVAVADTGTTAENVTLIVNAAGGVLANDTDLDLGDTHTVSAVNGVPGNVGVGVTGTNGGTFTIAANGSYTFNPGAAFDDLAVGQTRTTSVTYTNLDSNGGSASSTLTITVTGTNDAPVAVADTGTTAENVTLIVNAAGGVLANDTDLDLGDTHTVSAVNGVPGNVGVGVTGTNGGTFTIAANGSYTFNPGAAFDDRPWARRAPPALLTPTLTATAAAPAAR